MPPRMELVVIQKEATLPANAPSHVQQQEARVPVMPFQIAPDRVQRVHVESDVCSRHVQQRRGEEAPELPLEDQRVDLGPQRDQVIVAQQVLAGHLQQENDARSRPE